ncbi:hypothetical protein [Pseudomonas sp. RIT-PI-AD]|uniref:hypothetical protein n=1 Tax=Pseudomonas sp. RIT-PI-AD TaxID=3035294 RepID=UPI0021DB4A59|nr:hypothetical protein [Pseudomonas sp. RIT-PI-AD]
MSSRLLALPLSILLLLSPLPSLASDVAAPLLGLHRMRLAVQKSLGDFYMFKGMEGDRAYARMLEQSIAQARTQLDALGELPTPDAPKLREQLREQWLAYVSQLESLVAAFRKQGFTDLQPVTELATRNQRVLGTLDELSRSLRHDNASAVPAPVQSCRDLSVSMRGISVEYASRSASVGALSSKDSAIDRQTGGFAERLQKLRESPANTDETRQTLQRIEAPWHYIETALHHPDQNSMPLLVDKYAGQIVEGLERLCEQYAAAAR